MKWPSINFVRHLIFTLFLFLLTTTVFAANSWKVQTSPVTKILRDIQFISSTTGFAVGDDRTILKTTNEGATWTAKIAPSSGITIEAVDFPSSLYGYAVGNDNGSGVIYKTTDGGETWTTATDPGYGPLDDVSFYSTSEGFICGDYNTFPLVVQTINGGSSWTLRWLGAPNVDLYGIDFVSTTNGWLVGANGNIRVWNNASLEWNFVNSGVTDDLKDIFFINSSTGWAVGGNKILKSVNTGSSWTSQEVTVSGRIVSLEAVHFSDASEGWAAGFLDNGTGRIFRTTDGGTNWTDAHSATLPLYGVAGIDSSHAAAVGGNSSQIIVYSPDPSVTSFTLDGYSDRPLNYTGTFTIEGTFFSTSATVGAAGMDFSISFIAAEGTRITGTATCTAAGAQTITVYNPDNGTDSTSFTVNPLPNITSVDPASASQGDTLDIEVNGTGFQSGLAAGDLSFSGSGVTVNSLSRESQFKVNANISISGSAATGARDVTITNPDSGSDTGDGVFSIGAAGVTGPTITSLSPNSGTQGATALDVTITGSNFHAGPPTVVFGNGDITVNSVTYNSSTSLTVNIDIDATAETKARTVTVTNTDDSGVGSLSSAFYVVAPGATYPTMTQISPNSVPAGSSGYFIITGTSFSYEASTGQGSVVTIDPSNSITISNIVVEGTSLIRVYYSVDATALVGARNVTIVNPDGTNVTGVGAFTISQQASPATSGQLITGLADNNPWNPQVNPNVTIQFRWPGAADTVKFIFVDSNGQIQKAPVEVNVVPGLNNVIFDANNQFGHQLPNGMHVVNMVSDGKVVGKCKLVVYQ